MKKVTKPSVGQLVEVPVYEFAPQRSGWNGWLFRIGVIDSLYISKTGRKCAKVRFCNRRAGRYQLLPCEEMTKNYVIEHVFQWDSLPLYQKWYEEGLEAEKNGEQVCWSEDTAFLLNNGYIK